MVGDPNQSVYGFNGADPTLLDRLPELLRGHEVIRLDENHRCTPQVVAVATAVLREGGAARASVVAPPHDPGRRAGAPGGAARHRRRRGGLGGRPGQDVARPGPAVVVDRRADPHQRATGHGAGGHGRGAGAEPGRRLRPRAGERPARRAGPREPEDVEDRRPGRRGRPGATADRVVLTTFHRAKGLQWPTVIVLGLGDGPDADRLGADAGRRRRGAPPALRRADPCRRRAVVQLVRAVAATASTGAGPRAEPVAGSRLSGRSPSLREGGGADGGRRGLGPGGRAATAPGRGSEGADAASDR